MPRIAKRTNRTRDKERPPRLSPAVNVAILASLGLGKAKPALRPTDSQHALKKRRGNSVADAPKPAAANQLAAKNQAEAKEPPATRNQATPKNLPAKEKPAARQLPVGKQPLDDRTGTAKPAAAGEKPGLKKEPGAGSSPTGGTPPVAREDPKMKNQQAPKPPQVQKKYYNQTGARPPGIERRPTSGNQRPIYSLPEKKTQPDAHEQAEPKTPPSSPAPGRASPTVPPTENRQSGIEPPGRNGSGVSTNGNGTPKNGFLTNGNGLSTNRNGVAANGHGAPINENGSNGKPPAANGSNGHTTRSSLFGPGAFTKMPAVQIPPKAGGPTQKPPSVTQIPMEISQRPDENPGHSVPNRNENALEPRSQSTPPAPVPQTPSPGNVAPRTSGLEPFLKQNPNLPGKAAVFGVCEDGLPVLLDLQDPAPGAVVVIGDDREDQLEFLRTAVASVIGRNSPRDVQFLVFSCEPDTWQKWVIEKGYQRHCLSIENADEGLLGEWILRLADWTEQRRLGQSSGPAVILVMDTLSFLTQLEYDVRLNFDWMAKEGPPAQIWPLAVISTNLAKALSGRRLLRGFQTRIIGYASQPTDLMQLANVDAKEAETLGKRGEFAVKVGENWLRFKLPGK